MGNLRTTRSPDKVDSAGETGRPAEALSRNLHTQGWLKTKPDCPGGLLHDLVEAVFAINAAGARCLLDQPLVRETAVLLRQHLASYDLLSKDAIAVQAIAFDKTAATNWKVSWHQDVMFPLARQATTSGYELSSRKDGVDYARPPREVLERMLAVRLHLDDCGETNGPLRVVPGSHLDGILRSAEIPGRVAGHRETTLLADAGEALLMKPLLLHASSPAKEPGHRRVLHLVYHDGSPVPEPWHRRV